MQHKKNDIQMQEQKKAQNSNINDKLEIDAKFQTDISNERNHSI